MSGPDLTAAQPVTTASEGFAQALADTDQGIAKGELFSASHDLTRLIGRPTISLSQALRSVGG
jgi:NAD(P)H dehydrogenase (quinone)